MDAGAARSQGVVARFATYEEYLDSQTTNEDLEYLQDETLARRLVELGYRGSGETLKRFVQTPVLFDLMINNRCFILTSHPLCICIALFFFFFSSFSTSHNL